VLERIATENSDNIRLIYRHFPLISIHDKAQITAEAAEAAGAQGKFWEMHDILFEQQANWESLPEAEMIDVLVGYAEEVDVQDLAQFQADLENDVYAEKVLASYQEAVDAGLTGTPALVVNQVVFPSQQFGMSYQGVDAFIRLVNLRNNWYAEPEQVIEPDKSYIATIQTEQGDIVLELFADTAPVNVNSFVFLANQGWYKDTTFHRVLEGFVAQGGDPTGTGIGFPGYRCGDEVVESRQFDDAGVVSLANSGPNSNGSQFFITYAPVPQLNENFTIIGRVIEGMDVAEKLTPRDPQTDPLAPAGDRIIDILIEEQG
jgi:cyclophilin family peptidyl-prolyl cis-trans isomerase